MLTCRDVSELASDYLEHELPPRGRFAMRLHLMVCRMCRRYVDQLRKTTALLRRGVMPSPPPEIEERLLAATSAPPPDPSG